MSLDYTLYVSTTDAPEQIAHQIAEVGAFRRNGKSWFGQLMYLTPMSFDPTTNSVDVEELSFTPTAYVVFNLDKFSSAESTAALIAIVDKLLKHIPGPAALVHSSGMTVLMKKNNELLLSANSGDFWSSERLAQIDSKYEFSPLPFL
jgi:hypothetical protein